MPSIPQLVRKLACSVLRGQADKSRLQEAEKHLTSVAFSTLLFDYDDSDQVARPIPTRAFPRANCRPEGYLPFHGL